MMTTAVECTAQNGLQFDGIDDYVSAASPNILGASSRTVEAWIKTTSNTTQRVIVDMGAMPVGQRFTLNVLNGLLRIEIGGGGINSLTSVADGNWHHVAATYDAGAVNKYSLYIDGILNNSGNVAQAINTVAGTNLLIGTRNDMINRFDGFIDEVRVWNYARTQTQINNDKNLSYCSQQPGLLAYHKFNFGIAGGNNAGLNTSTDYGLLHQNGTLNGFALTGPTSNWVIGASVIPGTVNGSANQTACGSYLSPSGLYTWTSSGTYADTIVSSMGCDSAMTVNLTIVPLSTSSITASGCFSYLSPSGNHTWTNNGTYQDTLQAAAITGCDSIITIQLSIFTSTSGIAFFNGCDSILRPGGLSYWDSTGTYQDTLVNVHGCDSFLTAFVTIGQTNAANVTETACGSYLWSADSMVYSTSGTYSATLTNLAGCDSVVTLNLTIQTVDTSVTVNSSDLLANATAATYQWIDCANGNVPINGATAQSFSPSISGNYACIVTQNGCSDTTGCYPVTIIGIRNSLDALGMSVLPNPSDGRFLVHFAGETASLTTLEIRSAMGSLVFSQIVDTHSLTIDLQNLSSGTYFLRILSEGSHGALPLILTK